MNRDEFENLKFFFVEHTFDHHSTHTPVLVHKKPNIITKQHLAEVIASFCLSRNGINGSFCSKLYTKLYLGPGGQ